MNEVIYHITDKDFFENQMVNGQYFAPSFAQEGFTHLSTKEQVKGTLKKYYQGITNLILLNINAKILGKKLIYEPASTGELFPHCYGAIPTEAIIKTENIEND